MPDHFFFMSFAEFGIAIHEVFDDAHHFYGEFPVCILGLTRFLKLLGVLVKAFNGVFPGPFQSLFVFFLVVYAFGHAADYLNFVYAFHAHAKIFFYKLGRNDGTGDTHADGTDLQVALAPHCGDGNGGAAEPEQFFFYVFGNVGAGRVLNIPSVNTKRRQAFLGMGSKNAGKIHRTGSFGAVKAPNSFYGILLHVHSLAAVAPAGSNGQCNGYAFLFKLGGAGGGLADPAYRSIGNNYFYRFAVGISQIILKQLCRGFGHVHGLVFKRLAYSEGPSSSVNDGTYAYRRVFAYQSAFSHIKPPQFLYRLIILNSYLVFKIQGDIYLS